ncbi:hypothetical protein COT63_01475 [Candidatus Shapirobacteria bacterium CG09_land_8_20_14_0_10_38_17]|uniref:Mannosyl-glycoprotein endo-beta-N-acetylglucosamidase-like domain-containing protein n=1 Tax=Candidatus Shapirobacteria bacterium CG09_land_8_20_14_0_10_38_17 TaxID=1974884 RepID=A0A2H0WRB4_9BACT|nr:MAG: hypothetical protein COT63_01475 [Candidatus Shapirobacteria bacterium CG09_land_8_20_14_0_10_38_17]
MTKLNSFFFKFVLLGLFLILTPISLFLAIFTFSFFSPGDLSLDKKTLPSLQLYTALPAEGGDFSFDVIGTEARPIIIGQYLAKYNSPLEPYADFIFQTSQKYNLDYRLLVAIAQQESNLGKKIPQNSYNAWGWGVHSQGTLGFSNWEEAIETVSRGLREDYLNQGLVTPEQIMSKYTPLSDGSWAFGVRQFMGEME